MSNAFDKIFQCLNEAILEKVESHDAYRMNIEEDFSEKYEKILKEFEKAASFLEKSKNNKDELAFQCALTRVRISSMRICSLYEDIYEDIENLFSYGEWEKIPENYKIPKEYYFE